MASATMQFPYLDVTTVQTAGTYAVSETGSDTFALHEAGTQSGSAYSLSSVLYNDLGHATYTVNESGLATATGSGTALTTALYGSRKCLLKPSDSYLAYFRAIWHPDAAIVDLFSTGASWSKLFSRLNAKARCWFIGRVDNYAYMPDAPRPEDWLNMTTVFRTSEFGSPLNKGVEMLNYAPHPVVEDVHWLPGQVALPALAETLEYDTALPEAAHRSFQTCIDRLPHYLTLPRTWNEGVTDLIKTFVRFICADPHLPNIYAGHHAADAAYLQQLLG
jgi:hypothetical protein